MTLAGAGTGYGLWDSRAEGFFRCRFALWAEDSEASRASKRSPAR